MYQRKSLPHHGSWGLVQGYDPYCAKDVPYLYAAARLSPSWGPEECTRVAWRLSHVALNFMFSRRAPRGPKKADIARRLAAMDKAARDLLALLEDVDGLFPQDIGHTPPVRELMGITPEIVRTNWSEAKAAAREWESILHSALPHHLRLLSAAATHALPDVRRAMRQGRSVDWARHDFVMGFVMLYQETTGLPAKVSNEGGRYGPAPAMLAKACELLRLRLTDEERRADPKLDALLKRASEENAAGLWIEEARRREATLPSFMQLRTGEIGKQDDISSER